METKFEAAFLKAVKKHASIKKLVKKKVDMIIENSIPPPSRTYPQQRTFALRASQQGGGSLRI